MKPLGDKYSVLVLGGGFFGMNIAEHFSNQGKKVLLCEKYGNFMSRASYSNQARIHNGYHYPRSVLTAMRSRISFPRFVKDFPECVVNDFDKYYGIGKILGKVNATQFAEFCKRIGAECEEAPPRVTNLFDSHYIEKIFRVKEYAFDAKILCSTMLARMKAAGTEYLAQAEVIQVTPTPLGLQVKICCDGQTCTVVADHVFNCTYSNLNFTNKNSGFPLIPLKYEMTEMALVEIPEELQHKAFTIMCGPFFSLMPFPSRSLYSLSHVRYTPHYEWYDNEKDYISPLTVYDMDPKKSAFRAMVQDSAKYLPAIKECVYKDSVWEVKTLLPSSETDDSRPILFKMNYGCKGYHCVMGGKIDNIYDIKQAIINNGDVFK